MNGECERWLCGVWKGGAARWLEPRARVSLLRLCRVGKAPIADQPPRPHPANDACYTCILKPAIGTPASPTLPCRPP